MVGKEDRFAMINLDSPGRNAPTSHQVVAVPTHISGIQFLENFLHSIRAWRECDICIVVNEYRDEQKSAYDKALGDFRHLPIRLIFLEGNHGEYGALYSLMNQTSYEEIFLLSHSCEVVDQELFEIVFGRHAGKSVALSFVTQLLPAMHSWTSFLGKYRRETLSKIDLKHYLPQTFFESCVAEFWFTDLYYRMDPSTLCLFPQFVDSYNFRHKFGKERMVIENEYLIKWKSHWTIEMVFEQMKRLGHRLPTENEVARYLRKYSRASPQFAASVRSALRGCGRDIEGGRVR